MEFRDYNKPDQLRSRNRVVQLGKVDFQDRGDSVTFAVRVIPRASKTEIVGEHNGALKVKLNAAPIDGAANDELIRLLAREFGVNRTHISIVAGQTSKNKRVRISGIDPPALTGVLKAKT